MRRRQARLQLGVARPLSQGIARVMSTCKAGAFALHRRSRMSLLQSLSEGSLLSDESLLQAREGYRPMPQASGADAELESWARRMTTRHELGIAREMAGLSEETLAGLASAFVRQPRRLRTDSLRYSIPVGAALLLAGGLLLSLDTSLLSSRGTAVTAAQTLAIGCLASGAILICIGVLA